MSKLRPFFFALAFAALGAACAPKLIVRHDDPSVSFVQVRLDGENTGFVDHGDTLTLRVRPGYHHLATIPRGAETNPWADDGEGWTFYVDRRAEVTLMPRD